MTPNTPLDPVAKLKIIIINIMIKKVILLNKEIKWLQY